MAAVDYFLKIDGIIGESQDAVHRGAIQVSSWHWAAENTGTMQFGGGGGGGRAHMRDFHFTMRVNSATPKLIQKLASGEHISRAVLTCRKAGTTSQDYLHITFEECVVSSYLVNSARGDGSIPVETIGLNFARVDIEYREQRADGTLGGRVVASHDMKQNRTV